MNPLDIFSILGLVGSGAGYIGELFKPHAASPFTSEGEYQKAYKEYRDAYDRGDHKRVLELEPSIQAWENQKSEDERYSKALGINLGRLAESESRGATAITKGLYGKGLRGKGEVNMPIEDLRREVAKQKEDILAAAAEREALKAQALKSAKLQGQYSQYGQDIDLMSGAAGLGLGTAGEFRQGGAFGGPTTADQMIDEMLKAYKTQGTGQAIRASQYLTQPQKYQMGGGPVTGGYRTGAGIPARQNWDITSYYKDFMNKGGMRY